MPYKDPEKQKQAKRAWVQKNRARTQEYHRRYRKEHPEVYTEAKISYRRKKLGEIQQWFAEFSKTMKCSQCPENRVPCLDFHHKDPATKYKAVSELMRGHHPLSVLLSEVDKCIILCANCHRMHHYNERNKSKADVTDKSDVN